MKTASRLFAFALVLCAAPLATATAQMERQQQQLTPEPIADDAPTAKQARAVAELLLAGDRAKLEAFLATNAAPSFTGSASYAADVTALLEAVKTGPRTIVRMDGLGAVGVAAALGTDASASPERAVIVRMDPTAPHQITGIRVVRIRVE